jgi:hypothetical protein
LSKARKKCDSEAVYCFHLFGVSAKMTARLVKNSTVADEKDSRRRSNGKIKNVR